MCFEGSLLPCLINQSKMGLNIFRRNPTTNLSKFRIIKNLIVISLSFMFLSSGDSGLVNLQTTMNKKGVGTATLALFFGTSGLTSLLFSSFIVKKLGTWNSQILGIILHLPFIASNVYPMWITMLLSAVLRGVGKCLLWAAQCTYFNESSVLYCKIESNRIKSTLTSNTEPKPVDTNLDKKAIEFKPYKQKIEPLSAFELLNQMEKKHTPSSIRHSSMIPVDISPARLTAYKCKKEVSTSENQPYSKENGEETLMEAQVHNLTLFNGSQSGKTASVEEKEDIHLDTDSIKNKETEKNKNYQSTVDSTKALFFGIHGLVYNSATIWSSLISYYILQRGGTDNNNKTSNNSCGVGYCSIHKGSLKRNTEEVPDDTRHLLIGVYMACGIVAPLLMLLFLDRMAKTSKNVTLSWSNVLATIKFVKKKDQILMIPFTIAASLCRGFYMADFTKSYIACAWSISHIGLITIIHGATSAVSSISSGLLIKYVGRRPVLGLCQLVIIANFVFLYLWNPNAQQPYLFYLQGGIFGMMTGIYNSQIRAFYGILFEGDEATAFSSFNLYNSMGWTMSFIYSDLLCVSIKIFIVLAFSCTGFIGYLLAERSYSLRNKQMDSSS